jgi:hypothetical protein
MTYSLTERLSVSMNYNLNTVSYQPLQNTQPLQNAQSVQNTKAQNYQNFTTQSAGMIYKYLLSERTTLSTTFSGTETIYTGSSSNEYKSLLFSLGVEHTYSPNWKFNLAGGVNYSFYSNNTQIASFGQFPLFVSVPTQQQKGTNFSPYFNLGATRRWTNLSLMGSLSRNQQASGYGYIAQVNTASLGASYNFTERWTGSLGGGYSLSTQSSNNSQNQTSSFNVRSQLAYLITERLTASSAYMFTNQNYGGNNISGSSSSHVHDISLMLTYSYPMHYQK